tara:strand:- start:1337 stop:2119 length:783 start_codon:yes stop_codon:yes gene_type:complete
MKNRIYKVLGLLMVLNSSPSLAQETESYRRIQLSSGLSLMKIKDADFSPLLYEGNSLNTAISGFWESRKGNRFRLDIAYNTGGLTPGEFEFLESSWLQLQAKLSYQWSVLSHENWNLSLGPRYTLDVQVLQWEDNYELSSALSFFQEQNLALSSSFVFRNSAWRLEADLAFSLISSYKRPPFNAFGSEDAESLKQLLFSNSKWASGLDNQRLEGESAIYYALHRRLELGLKHQWQAIHITENPEFALFSQSLLIALNFTF